MLFILEDNEERIESFRSVLCDAEHHIERAVPESMQWLEKNRTPIHLYSLDNDLILPEYEGEEGEGWQLCEWILANMPKAPIITHTTNDYARIKMQMLCDEAEWPFRYIIPFNGCTWIESDWFRLICSYPCR